MTVKKLNSLQESEVAELYREGVSSGSEIASTYNINIATVYRILHERNIPLRSPNYRVERRREQERAAKRNGPMPEAKVSEALTVKVDAKDTVVDVERFASPGDPRFAVEFRVKQVVQAPTMEAAIAKVKGYHGYEEVLAVRKIG